MEKTVEPNTPASGPADLFTGMLRLQGDMTRSVLSAFGDMAMPAWGSSHDDATIWSIEAEVSLTLEACT